MSKAGKIYLVGAGPGDPGLITVKGVEAIRAADVIVYDFLANSRLLDYAKAGAKTVYVGKKGNQKTISQDAINALIIKEARKGKVVVRLKGGDPFIFGRGGEEAEEITKAGIPYEVVPGVTSAIAASAYAGIPLTHRDLSSSVTFVTGQERPGKSVSGIPWDELPTGKGTLVFYMGWKNLPFITKRLMECGWKKDTPVALIRWGTMTKQRSVVGTLATIANIAGKAAMKPPVITVVGEVVRLRERLNWFESKPLFGKRVLVTRTLDQAGDFASLLENNGAEAIVFPVIKTVPPASWAEADKAIKRLSAYDWAIFTSVNGVKYFFERLKKTGSDLRALKGVKICAIGPRTKEAVEAFNLNVDMTPDEFVAEGLIRGFGRGGIKGKRFLLARATVAREVLPIEIKRLGGSIDVIPVYRTVRPVKEVLALKKLLTDGGVDVVTFTSSSTVKNFLSLFKKGEASGLLSNVLIACIGPITAKTAEDAGLRVNIMPAKYTIPAMTEALCGYFKANADVNVQRNKIS